MVVMMMVLMVVMMMMLMMMTQIDGGSYLPSDVDMMMMVMLMMMMMMVMVMMMMMVMMLMNRAEVTAVMLMLAMAFSDESGAVRDCYCQKRVGLSATKHGAAPEHDDGRVFVSARVPRRPGLASKQLRRCQRLAPHLGRGPRRTRSRRSLPGCAASAC